LPRLFGKYELLGLLGAGGMGVVYLARDTVLDRRIALKLLDRRLQEDPQVVQRFLNEARVAAGLNHPNIVIIHEFGKEAGVPFLAMELLEGEPLKTYLDRKTPLTPAQKLHVALQVARGLEYAHGRSIVHRDVKPGNIQIQPNGSVKLLDFGIAKVESLDLTQTGVMIGTPGYASPEQAQGHGVTPASDVFSFGVVLYEMLTGRKPFEADSPMALLFKICYEEAVSFRPEDQVPRELQELILWCFVKKPEERFPSLAPVVARLRPLHKDLASGVDLEMAAWLPGHLEVRPISDEVFARTIGLAWAGAPAGAGSTPMPPAVDPIASSPTAELAPPRQEKLPAPAAAEPRTPESTPGLPPVTPGPVTSPPPESDQPQATQAGDTPALPPAGPPPLSAEPPHAPQVVSRFLGAPTSIELERRVAGEMARTEFPAFNAEVARVTQRIGHVNTRGRAFEWNNVDLEGNRVFSLTIAPRAGFTSVRVEESFQSSARTLFGGFLGGLGGIGLGIAMAIGMGMFQSLPLATLLWAQFLLLAYLLARYFFTAKVRLRTYQLQQLLDRICEHVERTALPAGAPGNAPYRPSRSRPR
jgi:serine/threonine protein kinase